MNMINKYLLRVLGVSPKGQPQVADIYTGCRMSLAPLRSGLGSSGLAAAIPPIKLNENCANVSNVVNDCAISGARAANLNSPIFTRVAACHLRHSAAV